MALKKSDIKKPALPMEAVPVDELGGEIIVRGLRLSERLALATDDEAGFARIPRMLAACVVDADQVPIYTAEDWEVFGARHPGAVLQLWEVAKRLSGLNPEAAEKN